MNSAAKIEAIQELLRQNLISEDHVFEFLGISRFKLTFNELLYVKMDSIVKVLYLND